MGTAHYIAPEQALGAEAEPASDVYSLAVVGYECLVGHRPFLSENAVTVAMMHIRDIPPPLPPDVPPAVRTLVEATLIKDPRQRYAGGGEFAAAVAAVRAGGPPPTPSGVLAQQHAAQAAQQAAQQQVAQQQLLMQQPQQLPVGVPGGPPTMPPSAPVPPPMGASGPQPGLSYPMPARPPRHKAVWVLLGLLLLVLIGLGVWAITEAVSRGGAHPPGSSGTTGASGQPAASTAAHGGPQGLLGGAQPAQIRINQSDYLGRPADLVVSELHQDGLGTTVITDDGAAPATPASCKVSSVTPAGAVPIGTVVTITCRPQEAAG